MMNTKTTNGFIKKMERAQIRIEKERDALDDAISEMKTLKEDCDEAWTALQDARDALSKLQ